MYKALIKALPKLGIALVVLLATWVVAMGTRKLVTWLISRSRNKDSFAVLIGQVTTILTWLVGIFTAMVIVFPSITPGKFIAAFGVGSVAIGFAFKDIFENFFAGFLILWRFPFSSGDFIECGDLFGKIEKITIRNTVIRQVDGQLLLVPNAKLFGNPVLIRTNLERCRTSYVVGIGYEDDIDEAIEVIDGVMQSCETVWQEQPIQVFVKEIGANSINLEVTWWTDAPPLARRESHHEVLRGIKKALDEAGIDMPFPQRVLTFAGPALSVVQENNAEDNAKETESPAETEEAKSAEADQDVTHAAEPGETKSAATPAKTDEESATETASKTATYAPVSEEDLEYNDFVEQERGQLETIEEKNPLLAYEQSQAEKSNESTAPDEKIDSGSFVSADSHLEALSFEDIDRGLFQDKSLFDKS